MRGPFFIVRKYAPAERGRRSKLRSGETGTLGQCLQLHPNDLAVDLKAAGDPIGAHKILVEMLAVDLRCLDAHSHLGRFAFERRPEEAIRYYEVGVRIGELSLTDEFDGVLPWGLIDNRPFLRCMHGFGLCLWRLDREEAAAALFERMLWLNPADNQGIRFLLPQIRAGEPWKDDLDERS